MDKTEIRQRDRPIKAEYIGFWDRLSRFWSKWATDLLLVAGAAAITVGAALVYPPAGWIAGGVLAIAGGVLAAKGGGDG